MAYADLSATMAESRDAMSATWIAACAGLLAALWPIAVRRFSSVGG